MLIGGIFQFGKKLVCDFFGLDFSPPTFAALDFGPLIKIFGHPCFKVPNLIFEVLDNTLLQSGLTKEMTKPLVCQSVSNP